MEELIQYSPLIVAVMIFFIQQKIFVTPEQLEKKHREIIESVEAHFVSRNSFDDLKEGVDDMKDKIDKIYDCLITFK